MSKLKKYIKIVLPWGMVIVLILVLFTTDIKELLLNLPGICTLTKNMHFISSVLTKYFATFAFGGLLWLILFWRTHMNVTVPKFSIAGVEIHLKNIDGIVKANLCNYLNTKRTLFKINCEQDNFDDVFESYHKIYEFIRKQMSFYESVANTNNDVYHKMELMIKDLNIFLTANQTNYRRWYRFENEKGYKPIKELQQLYPEYENLIDAFKDINQCMKKHVGELGINIEKW